MRIHVQQINFWRIWLPVLLCIVGISILVADHFDLFGTDAFAGFCGAGLSIALTNILWRMGIAGNLDRDDEEDARQYLATHGHWPDEDPITPADEVTATGRPPVLSNPRSS